MNIEDRFSQNITSGRVFMMLGVVMIHCNVTGLPHYDGSSSVTSLLRFLTPELTSVCVPWFFFISAYLTGYKDPQPDLRSYRLLLHKRIKNILIPYILWNLITFLIRAGIRLIPLEMTVKPAFASHESIGTALWSIFIDPELIPLWFLRNIFIFILILPVIFRMIRISIPITLIILWILDQCSLLSGILFFGLGYICALRISPERLDSTLPKFAKWMPLWWVMMIVVSWYGHPIPIVDDLVVLFGMLCMWGAACYVRKIPRALSSPDNIFFLYAFHGIISPFILKSMTHLFDISGYYWLLIYIITVAVVIALSYAAAFITKMTIPHIYAILTGSRQKKISAI